MPTPSPHDVIIVGSGAGGAAAAYRLVLAGLSVLMLEKGNPLPRDGSTLDDGLVVAQGAFLSKEAWIDGRGNAIRPEEHFNVGGKTKWYGAAVLRYSPQEFEPEAGYSARGWPIGYGDLEPYYTEAEQLLGARTFPCEPNLAHILKRLNAADPAWGAIPIQMALSPSILGNTREATHFDGFASAADLKGDAQVNFLDRILNRPNFTLRTGAEVVELLPRTEGAAAVGGIRLASGEKLMASYVLLAAGALHSPRLLNRYIASGRNPNASPLGHAGRNLKKHVLTALVAVSPSRKTDLLRKTMLLTNANYPHSSVQPLGFDGQLIATLVPKIVPRFLADFIGQRAYGFFLQTEDGSNPDNRVSERPAATDFGNAARNPVDTATDHRDAASQPPPTRIMDYDVSRTPAALSEHKAFTRAFQHDLLRSGMISFTQATGLNGTAHVVGTLVAGSDPIDAVVDADGAVFGLAGLYVVDGSVLPRSSKVNPSLSIYAWGLRVADRLAKSLGPQKR